MYKDEVVKWVLNSVKWVLNLVKQVLNSVKQVPNLVKQVLNSVKPVLISLKTQSNGRVNLNPMTNRPRDPETGVCSTTPRFSYRCLKLGVRTVSTRVSDVYRQWCTGWVYRAGMGLGWVGGGVIPGTQHQGTRCSRRAC